MSKEFTQTIELPQTPEQVHGLLTDETSIRARYEAAGYVDVTFETATATLVTSTRTDTEALPGPLAKLASVAPPVTQTDTWAAPAADGSRTATWALATKPLPAEVGGTITLKPNGTGTTMTYLATIKIKVPLLGGKLEPVALGQLTKKLEGEWAWLRAATV